MATVENQIIERAVRVINAYHAIRTGAERNVADYLSANRNAASWCRLALAENKMPYEISNRKDFHLALDFFA